MSHELKIGSPDDVYSDLFAKYFPESTNERVGICSAPGRGNLIGEHTDYNDGYVFPFGLEKRLFMVFRAREDSIISVQAHDIKQSYTGDFMANVADSAYVGSELPVFMRFILGPIHYIASHCNAANNLVGFDCVVTSTIPQGAGVSSSSALAVASALAFASCNATILSTTPEEILKPICEGEFAFSGVRGGIMDQFTLLNCQPEHLFVLDCRTSRVTDHRHLRWPSDHASILIVNSNVQHSLIDSPYNKRREACELAVTRIAAQYTDRKITHLRDCTMHMLERVKSTMDEVVFKRASHVIAENNRTLLCAAALQKGDMTTVGKLVSQSHTSLRDLYEVSCAELDTIVDIAQGCTGVFGARMIGGGFGGSCIVLVAPQHADTVKSTLERVYEATHARKLSILETLPGACASVQWK